MQNNTSYISFLRLKCNLPVFSLSTMSADDNERDLLDCSLCLKLFHEPITLGCGHTFCRVCIASALRVNKSCPLCRAPCYMNPRRAGVSFIIQRLIRSRYPGEHTARLQEAEEDEEDSYLSNLGLFILPDASMLFPGTPLTLMVFEPRYLQLMDICLEHSIPFGAQDATDASRGATISITRSERMPDGTMLVSGAAIGRYMVDGPATVEANGLGLYRCSALPIKDTDDLKGADPRHAQLIGTLPQPVARVLLDARNDLQRCILLKDAIVSSINAVLAGLTVRQARHVTQKFGVPPRHDTSEDSVIQWSFYAPNILSMPEDYRLRCFDAQSALTRYILCYSFLMTKDTPTAEMIEESTRGGALPVCNVRGEDVLDFVNPRIWLLGALLSNPIRAFRSLMASPGASSIAILVLIVILIIVARYDSERGR